MKPYPNKTGSQSYRFWYAVELPSTAQHYSLERTIHSLLCALQWELSPMYSYDTRMIQCEINIDKAYEYSRSVY